MGHRSDNTRANYLLRILDPKYKVQIVLSIPRDEETHSDPSEEYINRIVNPLTGEKKGRYHKSADGRMREGSDMPAARRNKQWMKPRPNLAKADRRRRPHTKQHGAYLRNRKALDSLEDRTRSNQPAALPSGVIDRVDCPYTRALQPESPIHTTALSKKSHATPSPPKPPYNNPTNPLPQPAMKLKHLLRLHPTDPAPSKKIKLAEKNLAGRRYARWFLRSPSMRLRNNQVNTPAIVARRHRRSIACIAEGALLGRVAGGNRRRGCGPEQRYEYRASGVFGISQCVDSAHIHDRGGLSGYGRTLWDVSERESHVFCVVSNSWRFGCIRCLLQKRFDLLFWQMERRWMLDMTWNSSQTDEMNVSQSASKG